MTQKSRSIFMEIDHLEIILLKSIGKKRKFLEYTEQLSRRT